MTIKRTVMRSRSGKRLFSRRDERDHLQDVQSFKKAQALDLKRKSQAEKEDEEEDSNVVDAKGKSSGKKKSIVKMTVVKKTSRTGPKKKTTKRT